MSKDKMTPEFYKTLPWRIASHKWLDCFYYITGIDGDRELKILSMNEGHHPIKEHRDRIRDNANAIISAVNSTYGQNIAPEAVKDMYDIISDLCECIANFSRGVSGCHVPNEIINRAIKARIDATIK